MSPIDNENIENLQGAAPLLEAFLKARHGIQAKAEIFPRGGQHPVLVFRSETPSDMLSTILNDVAKGLEHRGVTLGAIATSTEFGGKPVVVVHAVTKAVRTVAENLPTPKLVGA